MLTNFCRLQYLKSVFFAVATLTFMLSAQALAGDDQVAPASVEFEMDEEGALVVENNESVTVSTNTPTSEEGYSTSTKIAAGVTFAALTVVTVGMVHKHRRPILNTLQKLFQSAFGRGLVGQAVVPVAKVATRKLSRREPDWRPDDV